METISVLISAQEEWAIEMEGWWLSIDGDYKSWM